jgi:hypothetical protein
MILEAAGKIEHECGERPTVAYLHPDTAATFGLGPRTRFTVAGEIEVLQRSEIERGKLYLVQDLDADWINRPMFATGAK